MVICGPLMLQFQQMISFYDYFTVFFKTISCEARLLLSEYPHYTLFITRLVRYLKLVDAA